MNKDNYDYLKDPLDNKHSTSITYNENGGVYLPTTTITNQTMTKPIHDKQTYWAGNKISVTGGGGGGSGSTSTTARTTYSPELIERLFWTELVMLGWRKNELSDERFGVPIVEFVLVCELCDIAITRVRADLIGTPGEALPEFMASNTSRHIEKHRAVCKEFPEEFAEEFAEVRARARARAEARARAVEEAVARAKAIARRGAVAKAKAKAIARGESVAKKV